MIRRLLARVILWALGIESRQVTVTVDMQVPSEDPDEFVHRVIALANRMNPNRPQA